jgi:ATP-dependent helicase/nuclease subunit B
MIKIVLGIDSKKKENYIFSEINENYKKREKPILVVVPEHFTLNMERKLLEALSLKGMMGLEVVSFSRLVNKVVKEMIIDDQIPLTSLGRKLLVKRIINEKLDQLKVYYKSFNKLGLVNEIEEIIKDLRNEKISASDLEHFKDQLTGDSLLKKKIEDILVIYYHYETIIEDGYIDETIKYRLFIDNIDLIPSLLNSEIYILQFTGFSLQELEIIKALEENNNKVTFSIDYDEKYESEVYSFTKKTFDAIYNYFDEIKVTSIQSSVTELQQFGIILNQYEEMKKEFPVKIFTGRNIYSEVAFVVGEINTLIRTGGIKSADIGILLANDEAYGMILNRELEKYKIPYIMDEKKSIKDTNIIRAIIMLLQFYNMHFETGFLLKYLKYIVPNDEMKNVDILENYALEKGINHEEWTNPFEDAIVESNRLKYVEPLIVHNKKFKKNQSVSEFTEKIINLLNTLKIKDIVDREIKTLKLFSRHDEVLIMAQVWNRFLEIIDQMSEATGEEKITLKDYIEYLKFSFESEKVGIIPSISDGIEVGVLGRSVSLDKKINFVLGMNEGNLPKDLSESSILSEADKEVLLNYGFDLHNHIDFYRAKEKLDFFRLISKTEKLVYFTLSSSDKDGKGIKPSYFVTRTREISQNLVDLDDLMNEDVLTNQILLDKDYFKINLIRKLRAAREGHILNNMWRNIIAKVYRDDNKMFNEIIERVFYSNQVDTISKYDDHQKLFTSITKLEKYSKCPYSYFAQYDLKARERKEFKVSLPDIGNVYHEVLQLVVDDMISEKEISAIEVYIEKTINQPKYFVFKKRYGDQYLVKKVKETVEITLENIVDYFGNSSYSPKFTELEFTHRTKVDAFSPVEIKLDEERFVAVEGKIDRIDLYKDENDRTYCNIVDYKTGKKDLILDRIIRGIDYQLAIYLLASLSNSEALGTDKVLPSAVLYYRIHNDYDEYIEKSPEDLEKLHDKKFKMTGLLLKDKDVLGKMDQSLEESNSSDFIPVRLKKNGEFYSDSNVLSEEGFDKLLKITKDNIKNIGNKILNGEIEISPIKEKAFKACDYCRYKSICKFDTDFINNDYRYVEYKKNSDVIDEIGSDTGD